MVTGLPTQPTELPSPGGAVAAELLVALGTQLYGDTLEADAAAFLTELETLVAQPGSLRLEEDLPAMPGEESEEPAALDAPVAPAVAVPVPALQHVPLSVENPPVSVENPPAGAEPRVDPSVPDAVTKNVAAAPETPDAPDRVFPEETAEPQPEKAREAPGEQRVPRPKQTAIQAKTSLVAAAQVVSPGRQTLSRTAAEANPRETDGERLPEPARAPLAFAARVKAAEVRGVERVAVPPPAEVSPERLRAEQESGGRRQSEAAPRSGANLSEAGIETGSKAAIEITRRPGATTETARSTATTSTPVESPAAIPKGTPMSEGGRTEAPARQAQAADTQRTAQPDEITQTSGNATRIDLKLGNRAAEGVNVQVVERAGRVHVAVRTPDTQLASSLQDGLPRLIGQMGQRGFQAETWTPASSPAASPESRDTANQGFQQNGNHSGGEKESGGGNRDEQQQQERRRQDPPAWMKEFDRKMAETAKEETPWTQLLRR